LRRNASLSHIRPAPRSMPRAIRPNEATRPVQQNSKMVLNEENEESAKRVSLVAGIAAIEIMLMFIPPFVAPELDQVRELVEQKV